MDKSTFYTVQAVNRTMGDVFGKALAYDRTTAMRANGVYAFYQAISDRQSPGGMTMAGRSVIMAGSNDYLGLAGDPRVISAAQAALHRFGSSSSGSRLFNGTFTLHAELEERLAAFLGKPAAVVVTSGYQTNLAIASLLGRDDTVFADRNNHASLVDAVRLSFAVHRRFRHGDLSHLDSLLAAADPAAGKLIVTDGAFSMEGDVADLTGIVKLARHHQARVLVDGAHDIGLLGYHGRGAAEYHGVLDDVDLIAGTLSKCFGSIGGVLAGPAEVIEYLRHTSRSILFSAAMPPASAAAALAALDIIESEPARRTRAWNVAESLHNGLRAVGFSTTPSQTPIVPIHIGDNDVCLRFWADLLEAGVYANAVISPGVPQGSELIRVTLAATHTDAQIDRVLTTFTAIGRRLGVIPKTAVSSLPPVILARPS